MIEAYKIAVDLVMDQSKILGPLGEMIRGLEKARSAVRDTQMAMNEMVSDIRGATRSAATLADTMERVATAARAAAVASKNIRGGFGGGLAGGGSAASTGAAASPPTSAAASPRPVPQEMLRLTHQAPLLMLPYYPGTNGRDVTGRTPQPYQIPGTGFDLVGSPFGPSNALVPAGPRMDRTDVFGSSPNRGALVPYAGGGSYVPPNGGLPSVYNQPPPTQGAGMVLPNLPPGAKPPLNWPSPGKVLAGGVTAYYGSELLADAVAAVLKPALDLQQASVQIGAQTGMSDAEVSSVINLARSLQRKVPGTNVMGNLGVYRMLFGLTQDKDEAATFLPAFLPTGVAFNAFDPQGGTYDEQLEAVGKSSEFLGAISKIDPKSGKPAIDARGAMAIARDLLAFETVSRGAVDPNIFLGFLRSGGTAAANMDVSQMPGLLPIIQAMGARGAGQGLKSFEQQFSSGKMSEGVLTMLTEMGIVKDASLVRKVGLGQFMLKPGAMDEKTVAQAAIFPLDFFRETLLPATDKYLTAHYGTSFTDADHKHRLIMESATLQSLASRIPGGTLMGEMLRNMLLSQRDAGAVTAANGRDAISLLDQSPITKIHAFTGALNDLLGEFGTPAFNSAMGGLVALTRGINQLVAAGQNENVATGAGTAAGHAAEVGAGLSALYASGKFASKVGLARAGGAMVAGAKFGTKLGAAGIAAELVATGVDLASPDGNFGAWIDRNVPGAGWLDRWAYRNINPYTAPLGLPFGQDNMRNAPRAAPPPPAPPIATMQHPLPVMVTNGRDLANGVTAQQARQLSGPIQGTTGADMRPTPQMPGNPGSP